MKHIIGQTALDNKYNHWDLAIDFEDREWNVFLEGFLYSEAYDEINLKIARQGATLREKTDAVFRNAIYLPTVSLNAEYIARHYAIDQEKAEVRIYKHSLGLLFNSQDLHHLGCF